jgi:hypothetical protein
MKNFFEHVSKYIPDHTDYSKCGTCWKRVIESEIAKEFLKDGLTSREHYTLFEKKVQDQWKNTDLYKRVSSLREGGMSLDEISEYLSKEGIEI